MNHSEATLPRWVQQRLDELRSKIHDLERELVTLKTAHAILNDREWFTLPGPSFEDIETSRALFILDRNHPFAVATLGKNDVLLIGRNCKENLTPF